MSSAEVAVKVFRDLENEDFRVLNVIEAAMSKHEFVPKEVITKYAKFNIEETEFRINRLLKMRLIRGRRTPYVGYTLNYAGYDCLAINALVKAEVLESFGKPLGVGKESDVYDALNPKGERIAVKFHRLGRISFRQTIRKRGYTLRHTHWLYQSRLAAEKEFQALNIVYPKRVAVPKPISQNRHVIAMGMIEGAELAEWKEIPKPQKILKEILRNIRITYCKAGVIHADLSEYNILLKPNLKVLIIDWPQYVKKDHPNAQQLLTRDVKNILKFFKRKHGLKVKLKEALDYVTGKARTLSFQ
ncbi:serine/threonine protein kinase [Candidatus Bathyarchaeota archaeon]|nr:MAG: serine/threonine protein kinase [Candidatus Bathyarchaeota archaeon]RJS81473.1 MAG: serine/threonine protein kinase [Candidatus Bathyarchaeota archaeon]RLI16463.1 MAG: serine/threonine protein kinase [Candidatus Bathyarchaeota archaeon]